MNQPNTAVDQPPGLSRPEDFTETKWTQVRLAGRGDGSPETGAALEGLCARYWPSIYGYLRRTGHLPADAEDLTQGFFAEVLNRNMLGSADRAKGRFRNFLLGAMKCYLVDRHRHASAVKRGPGKLVRALDFAEVERDYLAGADPGQSPEAAFDRQWAATMLAAAYAELETEMKAAGQGARFAELSRFLSEGDSKAGYGVAAQRLGMAEATVPVAVFRLKARYRALVERQVRATVSGAEDVSAEFQELFR